MRPKSAVLAALLGVMLLCLFGPRPALGKWHGTDVTVIDETAEEAGREAKPPLINTDQGDLLLFAFLLAGAAGGFVSGYYYHKLFAAGDSDAS